VGRGRGWGSRKGGVEGKAKGEGSKEERRGKKLDLHVPDRSTPLVPNTAIVRDSHLHWTFIVHSQQVIRPLAPTSAKK
jgi:hypothetical protein